MQGEGAPAGAVAPSHEGMLHGLRQLPAMRVAAPLAQGATLLVATAGHGIPVPVAAAAALLAFDAAVAAATWRRVRRAPRIGVPEIVAQSLLDVLTLAAMLYLTGGANNPFAMLLLLPVAIAASAAPAHGAALTAAASTAAVLVLVERHLPLAHPAGDAALQALLRAGWVASFALTAALLAVVVSGTHAAMRRREQLLATAREAQMRNEYTSSIGELAARCAHELSSPLSTMAVVVGELLREQRGNAPLLRDLRLLHGQIQASKQIVSNLANAAGHRRAESAGGAKLDQFLHAIVDRARALHPGATIAESLDDATPPPCILAEETLRQAVTSLIDHAVQCSPHQVQVSADWSGTDLRVVVRDRGPGFAPELLDRLEQPLDAVHAGEAGSGVLLSAVTLQRMGGRLALVNEPIRGARAELTLPLRTISIEKTRGRVDGQPVA